MRRQISILLIAAVLIEIAGFYCMYVVKQFYVKESAEISIHSKQERTNELRFAFKLKDNSPQDESFRWTDDDEFTYKGMMFDVSLQERTTDSLILHCINDSDELSLIEKFKVLFTGKPENKSSGSNAGFLQFLSEQFIPAEKNEISFYPSQILMHANTNNASIVYMSYEILKPPPQLS